MASDVAVAFGASLAKARAAWREGGRRLSQERLAESADLDRTYISLLERGLRQPTLETVFRLAEALGIPAGTLVRDTERRIRRDRR